MAPRFDGREALRAFRIAALFAAIAAVVACGIVLSRASDDNCRGFIAISCCCSNACCFPVEPGTVEHLGGDQYRVVASGQVVARTAWSPDGGFYRCACDFIDGRWTIHPTAYTRCIYPPMPMG